MRRKGTMLSRPGFTKLDSARLLLRRFKDSDVEPFLAYRNDPEVARYQSWETTSRVEALAFIEEQKALEPAIPGQWFQIALELKETGALIGDCAIKINEQDARQAEIGFTLSRQYQGKGFASEAVSRVLDYAFVQLSLHRVIAITDCENAQSVALLERLGMRREGHFIQNVWFKGKWGDEYLYAILKEEWLRRRRM
jgi:RimJ/RimL family protein N-acetyltransferase